MSSDVVIRAEGLGKKYVIGHQSNERYTALRDVIAQSAKGFVRTAGEMLRGRPIYSGDDWEEFWALKDVSFEVKRGDVVGIIGRNGAGKSTLLKVLSRITEPSEGKVEIQGRVASLLEVGTGFHPELTGRENIFLNGAILGMMRAEIRRKFDEIVDFSGVEKFLDTPVKRYSSGMYVRLAFAVAAHLEPEILIVDEVLAVGDTEFQKKCLGKMENISKTGRTVLFVSHNISAIKTLCHTGIVLDGGRCVAIGPTSDMIAKHMAIDEPKSAFCGERLRITVILEEVVHQGTAAFRFVANGLILGPIVEPLIGIALSSDEGVRLATLFTDAFGRIPGGLASVQFRIVSEPFRPVGRRLDVKVVLSDGLRAIESSDGELSLSVPDYDPFPRKPRVPPMGMVYLSGVMDLKTD